MFIGKNLGLWRKNQGLWRKNPRFMEEKYTLVVVIEINNEDFPGKKVVSFMCFDGN